MYINRQNFKTILKGQMLQIRIGPIPIPFDFKISKSAFKTSELFNNNDVIKRNKHMAQ